VFGKIKKLLLLAYMRATGSEPVKQISHRLRQYLALPLLKPEDMHSQMTRLKNEIKELVLQHCTREQQIAFNDLHNYLIETWMMRFGPEEISVYNAVHKTNNVTER